MRKQSYYVMNRSGSFTPARPTGNQYVRPSHPIYFYTVRILFPGNVALDSRRFIIENADIDRVIRNAEWQGSGEDMQKQLMGIINRILKVRGIKMLACKCVIKGSEASNVAWLEYTESNRPEYLSLVA